MSPNKITGVIFTVAEHHKFNKYYRLSRHIDWMELLGTPCTHSVVFVNSVLATFFLLVEMKERLCMTSFGFTGSNKIVRTISPAERLSCLI